MYLLLYGYVVLLRDKLGFLPSTQSVLGAAQDDQGIEASLIVPLLLLLNDVHLAAAMVFSNLQHHEKDAFFALLDELSSRSRLESACSLPLSSDTSPLVPKSSPASELNPPRA